ncbi:response regulator [Tepidimicrobium xylanilyticum]
MKIFIVEDDSNVVKILEKIIIDRNLGDVVGKAYDGISALEDILKLKPDIVLVDLLMPGKDGITLIKEAKSFYSDVQYIMISQVSSKDMIAKAYESGIEYYISKPINAIEVETVIRKVIEKLQMNKKLDLIQNLFVSDSNVSNENYDSSIKAIERVMERIGIIGEAGSRDIITLAKYLIDTDQNMSDLTIKELCNKFTNNPKTMEQRIRRTATVGLINLANLGIEDYMNEIFTEYSNGLYSFEQIKTEMDYIRGKTNKRGKVNIKKFIDGMVYYGKRES